MRLKRETEVAIAILVACAGSGGCRLKTAEAAKVADTSTDFTAHIALRLVNAGLLVAKRGRTGGLALTKSADNIFLGEVIGVFEDGMVAQKRRISPTGNAPSLEEIMAGANHAMRGYLDRFVIADLAHQDPSMTSKKTAVADRLETIPSKLRMPIGLGL